MTSSLISQTELLRALYALFSLTGSQTTLMRSAARNQCNAGGILIECTQAGRQAAQRCKGCRFAIAATATKENPGIWPSAKGVSLLDAHFTQASVTGIDRGRCTGASQHRQPAAPSRALENGACMLLSLQAGLTQLNPVSDQGCF